MEDIVRRHWMAAVGARHETLEQEHALAAVVPDIFATLAPIVGEDLRAGAPDALCHFKKLTCNERLMGCRDHAVGFSLRQVGHALIVAVDFNLRDIAAVAEQVTDGGDTPFVASSWRQHGVRLHPVAHREIRLGVHINLKDALHRGQRVRVGRKQLCLRVADEAERHQTALVQPLFQAHAHFGADFL